MIGEDKIEKEIWKPIKGYEGLYEVSNLGRVRSLDREIIYKNGTKHIHKGKILKLQYDRYGYLYIILNNKCDTKKCTVHRLVAEAFIPNVDNKPCIDHINTIKDDNRVENLRWVTYKENMNNELSKKHMSDRVFTEEWKKKISESNTGYKHSEEARKKMSEAHKGKKRGFDNPMSIMMVCIFPDGSRTEPMCQQDLMKLLKISHRMIKRLLETGEEYKPRIKNNKHLTGIKIIKIKED